MSRFNTIEAEKPSRRWIAPVVATVICGAALFWAATHIAGNCLALKDVFTYCSVTVTPK